MDPHEIFICLGLSGLAVIDIGAALAEVTTCDVVAAQVHRRLNLAPWRLRAGLHVLQVMWDLEALRDSVESMPVVDVRDPSPGEVAALLAKTAPLRPSDEDKPSFEGLSAGQLGDLVSHYAGFPTAMARVRAALAV